MGVLARIGGNKHSLVQRVSLLIVLKRQMIDIPLLNATLSLRLFLALTPLPVGSKLALSFFVFLAARFVGKKFTAGGYGVVVET